MHLAVGNGRGEGNHADLAGTGKGPGWWDRMPIDDPLVGRREEFLAWDLFRPCLRIYIEKHGFIQEQCTKESSPLAFKD